MDVYVSHKSMCASNKSILWFCKDNLDPLTPAVALSALRGIGHWPAPRGSNLWAYAQIERNKNSAFGTLSNNPNGSKLGFGESSSMLPDPN